MTINDINITGIDGESYFFLNPIFLKINSESKFVTKASIILTNNTAMGSDGLSLKTAEFSLQSNPDGIVYADISDYIKSISVYPNGYRSKVISSGIPNSLNDINIIVKVSTKEDSSETTFEFNKLFIRGYVFNQSTNNPTGTSLNLLLDNETQEIINVPYYKYSNDIYKNLSRTRYSIFIDVKSKIKTNIIDESDINILDHVIQPSCDPLMIRFLNSSGGYNHVVFNKYTYSTKSNVSDDRIKVNRFNNNLVSYINKKVTHDKEYTAIQEFDERFKSFIDELVRSQYVQVMFGYTNEWLEIDIQENTMPDVDSDSFEMSYKFNLLTSINI